MDALSYVHRSRGLHTSSKLAPRLRLTHVLHCRVRSCLRVTRYKTDLRKLLLFKGYSKMPTVRNARSLVTSRELPSGLQIWGKSPLNALFSVDADTDSASEESVKVIQGRVAHGTLYVRLTCPTMDNHHNKLSQVPEF